MKKISCITACYFIVACTHAQSRSGIDTVKANIILDEVVMTGSKTAVSKNYIPFNVTTVGRQQIDNSSESALLPVLADNVPGLFVTERGVTGFGVSTGAAGAISMRGLSGSPNTRVLMLINGVPQFMGIFGHPLPDAYVASDAEKVEVLHGAGSVLYGTNAMGGVINIITRSQQSDGYNINARALYGSYNTQKYMANAGWRKKGFSIMASVNHDRTDGHRANSDFKITNGFLKVGYRFSNHINLSAETNIAKYLATDPGPAGGTVGNSIDILRGSSYLTLTNNYQKTSGSLQLFYNYGNHKITDGFRSTDGNYGFSLSQVLRHIKNNTTTVGFDYKHYGGVAKNIFAMNGQGIVFGDHTITEYAPYILIQQTIAGKLILSAGARREQHSVYGSVFIPSGGVSFIASQSTTLKAAVAKGFRSPTILDLYLFPPANPLLQPEKMMNYEATVNQLLAGGKLRAELTVFNVQGNNMIQTVFQNGGPKNVNTGSFNNTGIELVAKYFFNNHFNAMLAYGYTNMQQPVVAAPKHLLNTAFSFTQSKWMLHTALQLVNGLYTQTSPSAVQSNYVLLNARAGYRMSTLVDIFVKGENLTNRKYQINYGYPMPGVIVFGGFNFHLSGNK
jgi:outer membrane cobalamin receptor